MKIVVHGKAKRTLLVLSMAATFKVLEDFYYPFVMSIGKMFPTSIYLPPPHPPFSFLKEKKVRKADELRSIFLRGGVNGKSIEFKLFTIKT